MSRMIIACSMMEDEIKKVYEEIGCEIPVVWVERGFHHDPAKLRKELQRLIDEHQDVDELLLVYGLCGNGMAGVVSKNTTLVIPRFDDCINLMLCKGKRKSRGLVEAGKIYLTAGWIHDQESILQNFEYYVEEYGEEEALEIFEMMYEHYKKIALIDTGAYDKEPVYEYARKAGELLNLEVETAEGSTEILKQLLTGQWDENFIVKQPGEQVEVTDFALSVCN